MVKFVGPGDRVDSIHRGRYPRSGPSKDPNPLSGGRRSTILLVLNLESQGVVKTKPEDDELLWRKLTHLRERHGMRIVDCDACGGAGCSLCESSGVGGIEFPDAEKRPPCGPK